MKCEDSEFYKSLLIRNPGTLFPIKIVIYFVASSLIGLLEGGILMRIALWLCSVVFLTLTGCTYRLDHFKVYEVVAQRVDQPLVLVDQFDQRLNKQENPTLTALQYFANPVAVNGVEIQDPNAHLVWYLFEDDGPQWRVDIRNRFGEQTLTLGTPEFLLAPAEKKEPGSAFPARLDHFKCYRVLTTEGREDTGPLILRDQFDDDDPKNEVTVLDPEYFCNPVWKQVGEEQFPIKNPRFHLTIYPIDPQLLVDPPREITVEDQFGNKDLAIRPAVYLGVPTVKWSYEVQERE